MRTFVLLLDKILADALICELFPLPAQLSIKKEMFHVKHLF